MNYLQAALGLPLAIVYKEDKANYFTALQTARKEESLQPFYQFMFSQYTQFLQQEIGLFQKNRQYQKPPSGKGYSLFF